MEYLSLKGGAAVVPASTAFHPKLVVLAVLAYEHLQNEAAYEEKARAISDNYDLSWEERRDRIESLLKEFCEQA
mgnify:CR=1 FL=1